ncbi:MAG TPA: class E sortase [Coriobacteriia bacterium]
MDGSTTATTGPGAGEVRRTVLRVLSNVMFGAAVGLLAYYGVTNLVNASDQAALGSQLGEAGASSVLTPVSIATSGTVMDLDGWKEQDEAFWTKLPEGGAFGRIVASAMGLDAVVVKGTRTADLRRGPGWIASTDLPGATGNVGISGHRTTYGHPFGRLDVLKAGDAIDLYSPYRRYRYVVDRTFVVTPDRVDVVAHTEEPKLTLTACHPPYSARYRLIVQAKLIDVRRLVP